MTIVKAGMLANIDEAALCRGDILIFQAGDLVPADLKLVEAKNLEVDEFELTGEIMPVLKKVNDGDTDIIVYRGSRILKGTGKGIVLAVGDDTEYGKVLRQTWQRRRQFDLHLIDVRHFLLVGTLLPAFFASLSKSQDWGLLSIPYLLLALAILLLQNSELFRYVLISIEHKRMESFHIDILDWISLVEMGNVDTVCFDKTGVLTSRHLEVKHIYTDRGHSHTDSLTDKPELFNLIKTACALCNDVSYYERLGRSNPIDKALISFATRNGVNFAELLSEYERIYEEPFESERRYMACGFRQSDQGLHYFAKGDPDVILKVCNKYVTSTGVEKRIDSDFYSYLLSSSSSAKMSGDVMIAMAYCANPRSEPPSNYAFLCLLQLSNPLVPGVRDVIGGLGQSGIRSVMLTGDRAETAARVGVETGIAPSAGACLTGRMIEGMALSDVARQSDYCSVFARLLPSHKAVLIRLFQQQGHRVAMVGDGPNDGLALKAADVGVSFSENASPVASRLCLILVNELPDVIKIVESGQRIKKRAKHWTRFRALMLLASVCLPYLWVARSFT